VPRPQQDELLSSCLARACRRAGLPIGTVMQALTGGRKWAPGFFQAGHVVELADVLGMQPMDLLWRHTVFPYATAFLTPAVHAAALEAALATGPRAVGMGAVTQSVSDQVQFRRYCLVCAREELQRFGESYWHREHNLPGVMVCMAHRRVLWECDLRASSGPTWSVHLPHEVAGVRVLARSPAPLHWALAERAAALLNRLCEVPVVRGPAWYREALVAKGLLSLGRTVCAQALMDWGSSGLVAAQRGGTATGRYLGLRERETRFDWLPLMVRPRVGTPFVPLKHLLFEALITVQPQMSSETAGRLDYVSSGPSGRDASALDRAYETAVRVALARHRSTGHRVRVSDVLGEVGCWSAFRHDRQRFPRVARAVAGLRWSQVGVGPSGAARSQN